MNRYNGHSFVGAPHPIKRMHKCGICGFELSELAYAVLARNDDSNTAIDIRNKIPFCPVNK